MCSIPRQIDPSATGDQPTTPPPPFTSWGQIETLESLLEQMRRPGLHGRMYLIRDEAGICGDCGDEWPCEPARDVFIAFATAQFSAEKAARR